MRSRSFTVMFGVMLMLGVAGTGVAQDNGMQQPSARQQLQHIHTPHSIKQELARLTKELELTPEQQQKVRPLLEEHHDKIQALLDKNPNASRRELGPQIHAISDETHREIHALLTDHQKELEKAMQQREHNGEENRRAAPPAATSPGPSSSASWLSGRARNRSFEASHLDCVWTMGLEPATSVVTDLGGDTRMGRIVEMAMTHAITWRPLVYDPLVCRMCAMSNGPNALAKPHAVSIRP